MSQETSEYMELSSEAYNLFSDNYVTAGTRTLEYWKSVWQIASRPYTSSTIETGMRENFDRVNQIVGLTVNELSDAGRQSTQFAEKLAAHSTKVQDLYVGATRGLVNSGISNLAFVKDTAERQIDDITKRFEEVKSAASAAASSN